MKKQNRKKFLSVKRKKFLFSLQVLQEPDVLVIKPLIKSRKKKSETKVFVSNEEIRSKIGLKQMTGDYDLLLSLNCLKRIVDIFY